MKRINSIHKFNDFNFQNIKKPKWYIKSIQKLKGKCIYCGIDLPKRKRKYCSSECKWKSSHSINDLNVTSLRRYIHQKDNFECQKCGEHFSDITPAGAELTYHWGEVHHIIPLFKGGIDHYSNMILLCNKCHKKIHKKIRMNNVKT